MNRPEKMAVDEGGNAGGFIPEIEPRGGEIVINDPRGVGDSPSPALDLGVLATEGFDKGSRFHGVGIEREVERLDFDFSFILEESFKENAPVFRDFIGIPIAGLMEEFEGKGVVLLVN